MAEYRTFNGKRYKLAYTRVNTRRIKSLKKELEEAGYKYRFIKREGSSDYYAGYDIYVAK